MSSINATTRSPLRLLCSSVDFGFGSAGKLLSILQHLEEARVTIVGSRLLAGIATSDGERAGADGHGDREASWSWIAPDDIDVEDFDAALVILDPILAEELTDRGLPVVYVDSLPHMWGPSDPICTDVFAYCAQTTTLPPPSCPPLAGVRSLDWVEPIVTVADTVPRLDDLAVVNVGGVHSPHLGAGGSSYVSAVVLPTVDALLATGRHVRVTGAVDEAVVARLRERGVHGGVVARPQFLRLVAEAGLLVTSPGMTTMLEAGAAGTPTLLLPPQNLSQILNADVVVGVGSPRRIDWPDAWLDRTAVDEARSLGEEAALEVVYAATDRIAERGDVASWLAREVTERVLRGTASAPRADLGDDVGVGGARRVADHVRRAARVANPHLVPVAPPHVAAGRGADG